MRGEIVTIDRDRGFFWVRCTEGERAQNYFAHCSALKGKTFHEINPYDRATFDVADDARGARAINVVVRPRTEPVVRLTGTITSVRESFGFIRGAETDTHYFFHFRGNTAWHVTENDVGRRVSFVPAVEPKGPVARDVQKA